jgi:hypothetical protein
MPSPAFANLRFSGPSCDGVDPRWPAPASNAPSDLLAKSCPMTFVRRTPSVRAERSEEPCGGFRPGPPDRGPCRLDRSPVDRVRSPRRLSDPTSQSRLRTVGDDSVGSATFRPSVRIATQGGDVTAGARFRRSCDPRGLTSCSLETQSRQGTVPSGTGTIIGRLPAGVNRKQPFRSPHSIHTPIHSESA